MNSSTLKALKVSYLDDTRRVRLDDSGLTFDSVSRLVETSFLLTPPYSLTYIDDENDPVTVTTDDEVAEAVNVAKFDGRPSLRFQVTQSTDEAQMGEVTFTFDEGSTDICHQHVSCDGCGVNPIKGNRFKCAVCQNFDFCESCEAMKPSNGHDKTHPFLKIRSPSQAPTAIIIVLKDSQRTESEVGVPASTVTVSANAEADAEATTPADAAAATPVDAKAEVKGKKKKKAPSPEILARRAAKKAVKQATKVAKKTAKQLAQAEKAVRQAKKEAAKEAERLAKQQAKQEAIAAVKAERKIASEAGKEAHLQAVQERKQAQVAARKQAKQAKKAAKQEGKQEAKQAKQEAKQVKKQAKQQAKQEAKLATAQQAEVKVEAAIVATSCPPPVPALLPVLPLLPRVPSSPAKYVPPHMRPQPVATPAAAPVEQSPQPAAVPEGQFVCDTCTLVQADATKCTLCNSPRPAVVVEQMAPTPAAPAVPAAAPVVAFNSDSDVDDGAWPSGGAGGWEQVDAFAGLPLMTPPVSVASSQCSDTSAMSDFVLAEAASPTPGSVAPAEAPVQPVAPVATPVVLPVAAPALPPVAAEVVMPVALPAVPVPTAPQQAVPVAARAADVQVLQSMGVAPAAAVQAVTAASAPPVAAPARFQQEVQTLLGMGFSAERFLPLLNRHRGNLERTLEDLL